MHLQINFDPGQPARTAQADLSRNFFVDVQVSACRKTSLLRDSVGY